MARRASLKRGTFLKDPGKPFLPITVVLPPAYVSLLRTGVLRINSKHLNFGFLLSGLSHLQEASSGIDKLLCWPGIRLEEKVGFLLDPHEVSGNGLSPSHSAKCCNHSSAL